MSFKNDIQPIFNANCVFCHVTGGENGGLNLSRAFSYKNLVGTPSTESKLVRIAPGKPDDSYLLHKIEGTQLKAGGSGSSMPIVDPPKLLDPSQRALIRAWVEQGAGPD